MANRRPNRLQWGRRANAAERRMAPFCTVAFTALQWGRRANAAERVDEPESPVPIAAASMGPPRERGGERPASGAPPAPDELQWGRRANAAESRLRVISTPNGIGLQWGRRANAAESPCGVRAPRSRWSCFNGAAARTRRRGRGFRARCARAAGASMGPPRERGGEPEEDQYARSLVRTLQWGRRANAAESRHSPRWFFRSA